MLLRWGFAAILAVFTIGSTFTIGPVQAVGNDNSSLTNDPDYKRANELIRAGQWQQALAVLLDLERHIKREADVYNLLGIVYRKLKDYPTSKRHYDRALELNPEHLPTLEYQGEWFIETGDIASARGNLIKLRQLCLDCHETRDLEAAFRKYGLPLP